MSILRGNLLHVRVFLTPAHSRVMKKHGVQAVTMETDG